MMTQPIPQAPATRARTRTLVLHTPGGPGRLLTQGSHRSGRAELPHPAPQASGFATGRSFR
jgi:hypothetical protein